MTLVVLVTYFFVPHSRYTTKMNRGIALQFSYSAILTYDRYKALKKQYGSLEQASKQVDAKLFKQLGCRADTVTDALKRWQQFDAQVYENELNMRGITFITIEDPQYPELLKQIADPPVFLYVLGNVQALHQSSIAMVGTRAMSANGKRLTRHFTEPLVQSGLVTVSGLAFGIDAEVAKQTLAANGTTVAVLAGGLRQITPNHNAALGQSIIQNGGAVVSEYPLDIEPQKFTFPARNRIVAGLSQATLVLEAGEGSGALITARLAFDYNREVFAVPGSIFDKKARGCLELIAAQTAQIASAPEHILQCLNRSTTVQHQSLFTPQPGLQSTIWNALNLEPQSVEILSEKLRVTVPEITAQLTLLELSNAAQNLGNGMWVKL